MCANMCWSHEVRKSPNLLIPGCVMEVSSQSPVCPCHPPPTRRAHLKECFETLKKNVPNVDEKKTSNLSVLRGALRYIQVRPPRHPQVPRHQPSPSLPGTKTS